MMTSESILSFIYINLHFAVWQCGFSSNTKRGEDSGQHETRTIDSIARLILFIYLLIMLMYKIYSTIIYIPIIINCKQINVNKYNNFFMK